MDAEVAEKLDALEARIAMLESFLGDLEDAGIDPIQAQHLEFISKARARREQAE